MDTFSFILFVIAAAWFWADSLRARERAIQVCRRACRERDVQLLDQTVSLSRIGPRWGSEGVYLRRLYRFDFSEDGSDRHTGHIILNGDQIEELSMGLPTLD